VCAWIGSGDSKEQAAMATGFDKYLGIRIVESDKDHVIAEMVTDDRHMNRSGRVHGGALMAFADEIGGYGTFLNLPEGASTTTIESKTNFFRAGAAGALRAESIPLHRGRTTMVWQTTIRNPDGRMIAMVTQTQMVLLPRQQAA